MIRIAHDWEFIETITDGAALVDAVSVGLVDVDRPDRRYYAVLGTFDAAELTRRPWLVNNVLPHLPYARYAERGLILDNDHPDAVHAKPLKQVRAELTAFILDGLMHTTHIGHGLELWADWASYDHVCLTTILGGMSAMAPGIPMFSHDVQQEAARLGVTGQLPTHDGREHHALDDADWCARRVRYLDRVVADQDA
jgi:hypothetical protein